MLVNIDTFKIVEFLHIFSKLSNFFQDKGNQNDKMNLTFNAVYHEIILFT